MTKILVAEDEKDIRELITMSLQFSGFEVIEARDGQQVLDIAIERREQVDIFLLDVRMPRKTGYQVCRELRMHLLAEDKFIIFLTAKGQEAEVQQGYEAGADLYILKPFMPDKLINQIERYSAIASLRSASDHDVKWFISQYDYLRKQTYELKTILSTLFSIKDTMEDAEKDIREGLKHFLTLDLNGLKNKLQYLTDIQSVFSSNLDNFEGKLRTVQHAKTPEVNSPLVIKLAEVDDPAIQWWITKYGFYRKEFDYLNGQLMHLASIGTKFRKKIKTIREKIQTIPVPDFDEIKRQLSFLSSSKLELENEVKKLREKLELAQSSKSIINTSLLDHLNINDLSHITGSIVHDVRNGLGVIRNTVGFLKDTLTDSPYEKDLIKISTSADFCELVLRNLSALGGHDVFQPQSVDLVVIVQEVYFLLKRKLIDIDLITQIDPQTPLIMADEGHMKQVFMNLIKNAGEAMPDGGTITFRTKSYSTPRKKRPMLRIELSDTGTGISQENQKRIFTQELFSTKEEGYGLGLFIVANIIERHGGKIKVKSELGKGTTFIIYLPVGSKE